MSCEWEMETQMAALLLQRNVHKHAKMLECGHMTSSARTHDLTK